MKRFIKISLLLPFFISYFGFSQDLFPIYTSYITDNMYIIHPANAGISDCAKIRFTARKQWLKFSEAPQIQTLSFNTSIGEKNGLGFFIFKDKNGYHSQVGGKITYAYHIDLSNHFEKNRLSFGLSLSSVINSLDDSEFITNDPIVLERKLTKNYFNTDFGFTYQYYGFFSHVSLTNIIKSKYVFDNYEDELKDFTQYIASFGYTIKINHKFNIEPSTMFRYIGYSQEKFIDINLKSNYTHKNSEFWGGVSLRNGYNIDGFENSNYLSSLIGVNYNNFIFSYSYTFQHNDTYFPKGDFHQLTLGINLYCDD